MKLKTISKELGLSEEELLKKSIKSYLEAELRKINAEIHDIYIKYNVKSLLELDEKINKGQLKETETFQDFTKLDYLEAQKEKLEKLLKTIT